MSQCLATIPLHLARKNQAPDRPLHFIASINDKKSIDAFCAQRTSYQIARALHEAIRLLGTYCVRHNSPQRLQRKQALVALGAKNSAPTARRYLDMLAACGCIRVQGDSIYLTHWDDLHPPRSDAFWEARAAHQRQVGARSSAAYRRRAASASGKLFSAPTAQPIEKTGTKSTVTSLSLNPSRTRTKTKPQAGALTEAAFAPPPDLLDPAKAAPPAPTPAPPKPAAAPAVVRIRAPSRPAELTDADMAAVDALSPPAPEAPEAGGKTDFAAWARRIKRVRTDAEVDADRAKQAAAKPVQQGTPSELAAAPARKPPVKPSVPITVPQLRQLVETHGRLLEGHDVNLVAVVNLRPSYDLARRALDVTVEALRSSGHGQRKAIGNAGGYWLNTIRYMRGA